MSSSKNLPIRIFVGFLDGVLNKRDAQSLARGFIERHSYALDQSSYGVTKYPGGFAYEIHEGGDRKALVPDILRRLNAGETVYVDSGMRMLKISRDPQKGFQVLMLPEGDKCEPTGLKAGKKLTPWVQDHSRFLNISAALMSVSLVMLACSVLTVAGVSYLNSMRDNYSASKKFNQLPSLHWPTHVNQSRVYVSKIVYDGHKWRQIDKGIPGPFDGMAVNPKTLDKLVREPGILGVKLP